MAISKAARKAAEAAAAKDQEIADMLNAARERVAETQQPRTREVGIQELFGQLVALAASATGKTFRNGIPTVSEQSAVKLAELALGYALQSRNGPVPAVLPDAPVEGETQESSDTDLLPIPNEIITSAESTDSDKE